MHTREFRSNRAAAHAISGSMQDQEFARRETFVEVTPAAVCLVYGLLQPAVSIMMNAIGAATSSAHAATDLILVM
jgi:hypothetical protein